jgi:hypothetical protein
MLVRLSYVSYSNIDLQDADITQILTVSKVNNQAQHVTGLLVYSDRYFFQCLEGERKAVNKTYQRILADKRHSRCMISSYTEILTRAFPAWSMEQVKFSGVNNELVSKYSETGLFQPYDYTPNQAEAFLQEVAQITQLAQAADKPKSGLLSWFKAS